ncbi:MAG: T9SS type A sorting domain-containing protein [Chitinophagales bacterium]
MKLFFIALNSFNTIFAFSQTSPAISSALTIPLSATVNLSEISEDYNPGFYSMEMPAPGSDTYRRYLIDLKEELYSNKNFTGSPHQKTSSEVPAPTVVHSFNGNPMGSGVPNDNDMAISNDGLLISVINSSIYIFDAENGDTLLKSISLTAFSDTLGLIESDYDPRVVYDPLHDKFVLVFLNGYTPSTSYIIVAFSETNDPLGEWNLYALPGNPKDNNRWTDYPMIALTEQEVFITGNLIIPDEPWQTGFSETLIWQMKLNEGYTGGDIQAIFRDSIYYDGKPVRNLCPVKGGATSHGPDMYFLSNRNFSESNDSIFIVHVTGELDEESTIVEVFVSKSNVSYGVPPFARQAFDHEFDTNDGRILEAFYENDHIQFVGNTLDPATGFCGIYHGMITDLEGEKNVTAQIIGDPVLDLGYPDISYTGNYEDDIQSIIICDHSCPEIYAGTSAFFFNYDTYSERTEIHTGETYVNVLYGTYERWGDYTGSQRKYNETGVVWMNGNYGVERVSGPFTFRDNATWIAKLQSNDSLPLATEENNILSGGTFYPNPFEGFFSIELDIPADGEVFFQLTDIQGRVVKDLLMAKAEAGKNQFRFSTQPLAVGTYFLKVVLNGNLFMIKQVIKQ